MSETIVAPIYEINGVRLYGVLSDHIDEVWNDVKPFLIKTLERSDDKYDLDYVYKALRNKNMQLWVAFENGNLISFGISQIKNYPTQKRVVFPFVGGIHMAKWIGFFEVIKQWAKSNGCITGEIYGRRGWERALKRFGFKPIHTILKVNL